MSEKKYAQSTVTSVRTEWQDIQFCKDLKIPLSDALSFGIQSIAEIKLRDASCDFTPDLIEQFIAIKTRDAEKLRGYIIRSEGQQKLITEILEDRKKKAVQSNETIKVRNIDTDDIEYIQASKFNQTLHVRMKA